MILAIDGSFALHRARFVAGKNGTPTRDHTVAIFMAIILRVLRQFTPSRVYIYFDRERSYHRLKLFPDYKGHRKNDVEEPSRIAYNISRDFLAEILPSLGFITILCDGIEADDFSYMTAYKYHPGVHVTDDRDWFGNLFPGWSLFRPQAKELISYEQFCTMVHNIENPRIIFLIARAIVGDKSDNIPGTRGVPWEQALLLAPSIFKRTNLEDTRYAKKVLANMEQIRHNINIMTPMWVMQSKEAILAFENAEAQVTKSFVNPLNMWKTFCDNLKGDPKRDIVRLSFDYTSIVQGFSYP